MAPLEVSLAVVGGSSVVCGAHVCRSMAARRRGGRLPPLGVVPASAGATDATTLSDGN